MARCIYTAVFGGYEEFSDRPLEGGGVDQICFTDDPSLRSAHWEVRVIDPLFPSDPVRSARAVKILSHEYVGDYDESLWVDNSVELKIRPDAILVAWLDGVEIAIPTHSFRASVLDEFAAVIEAGRDDEIRVYDQLFHYSYDYPEILEERPYWTAILARRQGRAVTTFERRWFAHVLRYSRRDQLSVNLALHLSDVAVRRADIDHHESEIAAWPRANRYPEAERRNPVSPADLRLRRAEIERRTLLEGIQELREQLDHQSRLLEGHSEALQHARREYEAMDQALSVREVELRDALKSLSERDMDLQRLYGSRSWRWARGLRYARHLLGRSAQ